MRGIESSTRRPPPTARCNSDSVINANHRRVMGTGVTDDLLGRHHSSHRASNSSSDGNKRAQGSSNDHRKVVVGVRLEQGGTATGGRVQVDKEACVDAPGTIRGLFFADDICLLAETMEACDTC